METEILGIVLATVLPLYPMLFCHLPRRSANTMRSSKSSRKLRDEHEQCKEEYHGF
jgi:hypothetical protein